MKFGILLMMFLFFLNAFANKGEQKKADKRVNTHVTTTSKKKEIQEKKAAAELKKKAKAQPAQPNPTPNPTESYGVELQEQGNAFSAQPQPIAPAPFNDPGIDIQREISEDKQSAAEAEAEKKETLKRIKKAAEDAGYNVNVIPEKSAN